MDKDMFGDDVIGSIKIQLKDIAKHFEQGGEDIVKWLDIYGSPVDHVKNKVMA